MFTQRLKEQFNVNEPIFTEEIMQLFPEYSRMQVFRFINKAEQNKEIVQFTKGVYFIPEMTEFGLSTITADDVAQKRYIEWKENIYGVVSGIGLLNDFSVTTQVPAVIEIVTNNETTRKREITIKNRRFILRKSRVEINRENVAAYTVLQLFDEFGKETKLDRYSSRLVAEYVRRQGVTKAQLLNLAANFPGRTIQRLIRSEVFNEIA